MFDTVLDEIESAMTDAGVNAVREFPGSELSREEKIVCIGLKEGKVTSSGCGDYIGTQTDSQGNEVELFALKAEMSVIADIYSPRTDDSGKGIDLAPDMTEALKGLPSGVRVRSVEYGKTAYDRDTDMFKCPCIIKCSAYFIRQEDEENGIFTDFILRGVLTNGE